MNAVSTLDRVSANAPDHVPDDLIVDFDVYAPPGAESDFHGAWAKLQTEGAPDIVWTPHNEGHWIATRGSLIQDILLDTDRFSSRIVFVPKSFGEQHDMLPTTLDPPYHAPYRRLINGGLSPRSVRDLEGFIRANTAAAIDAFVADGECDFITAFAQKLPIYVFLAMLELPLEDAPKMKYWSDMIVHPDGTMTYEEARQHFYDYIAHHMELRRGGDGTDMLSTIINAEVNGKPLDPAQIQSFGMQLLMAGLDTVVNFLGFVFWFLATNPAHRRQLIESPDLIPSAAEELLRRFPVVVISREVREDLELAGVQLKKGDLIVAPSPLVGPDGRLNPSPRTVDFGRKAIEHTTFGKGPHICPGAGLARAEIRIAIEEWLKRIPEFSVRPGADITFKGGLVATVNSLPLVWDVPAKAAA